ncbi:hypothetical protein [Streptomyces purpureus]|uniref:Cupin domain-containing protein n=1 Tax=Streptomyces purpureus TaxID=1951 RepID=A0A918H2S0_9ACTN|nr:hypothetical protein [Streptomyces purpureus]GGT31347.1 hypothetical protein GCM10014713_26040 [Streptomyces purpureus]
MTATSRADAPIEVEGDGVEVRMKELGGDMCVAFITLPKGTDMAPALKGLPDDRCQCPHWAYIVSGKVKMTTASGEQVYETGQAAYWAPGHVPEALEDSEFIDFSPTVEFQRVMDHIKAQG